MNAKFIRGTIWAIWFAVFQLQASGQPRGLDPYQGLVHVNGTELYCEVMGTGTPVVIVHGGPGLDHTYLLPQMRRLAVHHTLIFYDQRGTGRSSGAVDSGSMALRTFVEDLEGVRKEFGLGQMTLLGHSWGGLLAMEYAVRYPDNLHALILVSTTPASSTLRDKSFAVMQARGLREDSTASATIVSSPGFRARDPVVMASFFRLLFKSSFYDRHLVDSLTLSFGEDYPHKSHLLSYLRKDSSLIAYDIHKALEGITCPTLIIGGKNDMVSPGAWEEIQAHISHSRLILLDKCGHYPYIEVPDQFFQSVEDFLTGPARR